MTSTVAYTVAAIAHADVDTDFTSQLHTYGIYGPKDHNAWIGKIVCQRLNNNVDHDASQSARFVAGNFDRHNTTEQSWQFLSAAIDNYCPEQRTVLQQAAVQR